MRFRRHTSSVIDPTPPHGILRREFGPFWWRWWLLATTDGVRASTIAGPCVVYHDPPRRKARS